MSLPCKILRRDREARREKAIDTGRREPHQNNRKYHKESISKINSMIIKRRRRRREERGEACEKKEEQYHRSFLTTTTTTIDTIVIVVSYPLRCL